MHVQERPWSSRAAGPSRCPPESSVPALLEGSSGRTGALVGGFATSLAVIGAAVLLSILGAAHKPMPMRPPSPAQGSAPNDRASTAVGWLQGLGDGLISRIE